MNFLEANRLLAKFSGGPALPLCFSASGNVDPLIVYIRAAAAARGRSAEIRTLPFGTLGQTLLSLDNTDEQEVFLLLPWDFVPECDWRTGIPIKVARPYVLLEAAKDVVDRLRRRRGRLVYLPAAIPPLYIDPMDCSSLVAGLSGLAASLGAQFLDPACFALGNYLSNGVPVAGRFSSEVAHAVVNQSLKFPERSYKVLVTDLDNVLWAGLAAEDGANGVLCGSERLGFRHFLYQGLLAKLKASGVLLVAVSRNDLDVARAPIVGGKTLLGENDFVEILASYEPKSVHIRRLAESLNLGLDAFVFVDDNLIELAEVNTALSEVKCGQFPAHDDQLEEFLRELAILFARSTVSSEDMQRTDMYRRRLEASKQSPLTGQGADLTDFLVKLQMELTIVDRSAQDRERAIQLINKTNQFNLNGSRVTEDDVARILASDGRLYTASLDDRTGSHGEILACLVDRQSRIVSFVLSCRVFQRQVEYAFICWLIRRLGRELRFDFLATERNRPIQDFLKDAEVAINVNNALLDGVRFLEKYESRLDLFALKEIGFD